MDAETLIQKLDQMQFRIGEVNTAFQLWILLLENWEQNKETKLTLEKHEGFWRIVEEAIKDKWTIGINKLFDKSSDSEDLVSLIKKCKEYKGLFQVNSIEERLRSGGMSKSMVDKLLDGKCDASISEFKEIEMYVVQASPEALGIIRNIRNNWSAHTSHNWTVEQVMLQYRSLKRDDVQKILTHCQAAVFALLSALRCGDNLAIETWPDIFTTPMMDYPLPPEVSDLLLKASRE